MSGKNTGDGSPESLHTLVEGAAGSSSSRKRNSHGSGTFWNLGIQYSASLFSATPKDSAVTESKVRKVSKNSGAASQCAASTSSASATTSSSSSSNYKKELRFLTDFYPDQTVESGPLTRSKTRINVDSTKKGQKDSSGSRGSKKSRKAQVPAVITTPAEVVNEQARSPTPDPSS